MRCFIAIELDNETRSLLSEIQKKLADSGIKGNFTRTENLHLTIKFLGEIDSAGFISVKNILKKVSSEQKSFVLTLDKIGKFDRGNKKIIWAGLYRSRELEDLYYAVNAEVMKILPNGDEKRYTPHITLAREATLPADTLNYDEIRHSFRVSGISLMESTRQDGKLVYLRKAYESFS
ncbi:MAG TPA: RNA 2',3'-cyclic phosphodiesterase [Clostridiaceae bacterium]|nr:RNA 2',3'-cyclic phosphodiesterase [Clostridiaceae bacterium]